VSSAITFIFALDINFHLEPTNHIYVYNKRELMIQVVDSHSPFVVNRIIHVRKWFADMQFVSYRDFRSGGEIQKSPIDFQRYSMERKITRKHWWDTNAWNFARDLHTANSIYSWPKKHRMWNCFAWLNNFQFCRILFMKHNTPFIWYASINQLFAKYLFLPSYFNKINQILAMYAHSSHYFGL